jgi:hypothetical protein
LIAPDPARPVDHKSLEHEGAPERVQALDADRDDASTPARRPLADGVLGLMEDLNLVDESPPATPVPSVSLEEYRAVLLEDIGQQLERAGMAKTGSCIAHMTINRDGTIYGTRIRDCEGENGVHRDLLAALRAVERVPTPPPEYYTQVRRISFRVGAAATDRK